MASYNDYPQAVRNNAKRGIELNEKQDNKCALQTGKVRAQQLAKGEKLSLVTIKRMYNFLSRHEKNYDPSDTKACGTISYLLWGGLAAKRWAKSKIDEVEKLQEIVSVGNTENIIINGRLAYSTKEAAIKAAQDIGCDGHHTHDVEGKTWFMPCKQHKHAEIGPRGGVKPSKKAPKSKTPGEGKSGSKRNKPGAAKDSRSKVKVPESVQKSLQKKSDDFNERYKEKLGYGVTVSKLKAVYQRGVGAFQTSHSPNVSSAEQWGQARVNAFMYLVKNGRPQNAKYTTDYDLLPAKHPKAKK